MPPRVVVWNHTRRHRHRRRSVGHRRGKRREREFAGTHRIRRGVRTGRSDGRHRRGRRREGASARGRTGRSSLARARPLRPHRLRTRLARVPAPVGHRPGAQRPSGRPALRRGDDVHAADRRLRRLPRAAPTGTAKGAGPGQCTSLLRILAAAAVRPSHLDDRGSLLRHYGSRCPRLPAQRRLRLARSRSERAVGVRTADGHAPGLGLGADHSCRRSLPAAHGDQLGGHRLRRHRRGVRVAGLAADEPAAAGHR